MTDRKNGVLRELLSESPGFLWGEVVSVVRDEGTRVEKGTQDY